MLHFEGYLTKRFAYLGRYKDDPSLNSASISWDCGEHSESRREIGEKQKPRGSEVENRLETEESLSLRHR